MTHDSVPNDPLNVTFPLSFVQERRWFLEQMQPFSPHNIIRGIQIKGNLNTQLLVDALGMIFFNHEVLRSNIIVHQGEPALITRELPKFSFVIKDFSQLLETESNSEIDVLIYEEQRQPIDLANDLLLRITIIKKNVDKTILLLTFHTSVYDDETFEILFQDISSNYRLLGQQADINIELSAKYQDFAAEQRRMVASGEIEKELKFLSDALSEPRTILNLPTDRSRPAIQSFNGSNLSVGLNYQQSESIKKLSRDYGVSLFTVLLTGFLILLFRYLTEDDFIIGIPTSDRGWWKEQTVGCFTSFIPLRLHVNSRSTFKELTNIVKENYEAAISCQKVPLAKLLEFLQPERDLSRNPLFQVIFNQQKEPVKSVNVNDCIFEVADLDAVSSWVDLSLYFRDAENVSLTWNYNTDIFNESTVQGYHTHFLNLLSDAIENPQKSIAELNILSESELFTILNIQSATNLTDDTTKCIHHFIEERCDQTPDATAIIFGNDILTYREVNKRAEYLAKRLKALGVGPEVLVGLYCTRNPEMIIGMIGILKAGGAYVPLDPSYPAERISFIVDDTELSIVVTEKNLVSSSFHSNMKIVLLDSENDSFEEETNKNQNAPVSQENLAYLIYTSGSTGKPKGVMIQHRNASALIDWALGTFSKEQFAGVLASTSVCFDLSIFEIFVTLSAGGTVILAENALQLPFLEAADKITLLNTVPSAAAELLRTNGIPSSVKTINLAGEPLPTDLVQKIYTQTKAERVYDLYGPSEDTTYSTFAFRTADESAATIGRPIANTRIYILDELLSPVPNGAIGEIYIGGAGLARGYWKRPELTSEKFITNPFSDSANARLYKTGDRGRFFANGDIDFKGRIDHQVKVRGYRIELDEIRSVISSHPFVRESVVIVREDSPNEQRLVAYIVNEGTNEISVSEIRAFLKDKLPNYMIPSFIIILDAVPLTHNGKIDRKKLPAPDPDKQNRSPQVSARSSSEKKMIKIWENTLKIKHLSILDNFFELGGTSILAVRLFSLIETDFGKRLPLSYLFKAPTIEQLTKLVVEEVVYTWSNIVPIKNEGTRVPFFCVHGVGGNVLNYRLLASLMDSEQPFYGIQAIGLSGQEQPYTNVVEMAAHYITEMRQIQPAGPYLIGGHSFGGIVALEIAQQLQNVGEKISLLALFDTSAYLSGNMKIIQTERVKAHIKSLFSLNLKQKVKYIKSRVKNVKKRVLRNAWQISKKLPKNQQESVTFTLDVKDANYIALKNYQLKPYADQITLLKATSRSKTIEENRFLGWDVFAPGAVEVYDISGDHLSMLMEPNVRDLSTVLNQLLRDKNYDLLRSEILS